jgi:catechol 2,3-dioxygenase-like lactoylglutathione lyase family enzyme
MKLARRELDVGIATLDAAAAATFYRDLLGCAPLPRQALGALGSAERVRIGGHTLKLYAFTQPPTPYPGGTARANGMRLLAVILDDLPAVLARFDAVSHPYRRLPLPAGAPFEVAFSEDADGNALELVGLREPAGERLSVRLQIGLTVADIARSRDFYGRLLGFREEPEMKLPAAMGVVGDARYGFRAGATTIKLWSYGPDVPTATGAPARRTGIRLVTAFVDDVDAAHEALRARGVAIRVPPHDIEGLSRVMFLADPDGNWIELAQPYTASETS